METKKQYYETIFISSGEWTAGSYRLRGVILYWLNPKGESLSSSELYDKFKEERK